MKQYFTDIAKYNVWATDKVCGWLDQITDEQWTMNINSSFKSIAETSIHTAGAEKLWLDRWMLLPNPVFLTQTFNGEKAELIAIWKQSSANILQFITEFDEAELYSSFFFTRLNGEKYSSHYWQSFAHVINHSSYHRGQLVTMLRQAGFTDVSSTDMLFYFK